ncbi:hypothetical protein GVAV_002347 [Gurleya vavrai]
MILIFTKVIGIFFCIYGTSDSNYPQEYRDMLHKTVTFKFQYLTIIGLYITLLTLFLCLIHQSLVRFFNKSISFLSNITNFLQSVILPIEILITLVFWSLFIYNPKLIVCEIVYEKCGLNFLNNLCMHFVPFLLLSIEFFSAKLKRSNFHVLFLLVFGFLYYLFVKDIATREKKWPYPFLDKVDDMQRIVIFTTITFLCVVLYEICMYIAQKMADKIKTD